MFFPGRTDIEVKSHWMQNFAHFGDLQVRNKIKRSATFAPTVTERVPNMVETEAICTRIVIPLRQQQQFVVLPHINESGMK
jgi:hypothetical protein